MVTAPVLTWEEADPGWSRTQARRELHQEFDLWLDEAEEGMKEEPTSLGALTKAVFARRHELTGMITESLVRQRHAEALGQERAPCSQCGRSVRSRGLVSRMVETLVGEMTLERPYFYCDGCKRGFYPLDEALEPSPLKSAAYISRVPE